MKEKKNLTIEETFALAVQNQQKNNLQVAENLYKEILKTNPNHFQSNFLLGTLSAQTKKFDIAKQLLQKAIQIQPNYAEAHNNLASVIQKLGEPQKAVDFFKKAIQIQPNHISAHNNMLFTLLYFEKIDPKYLLSKSKEFRSSLKPIKDDLLLKYQFNSKPKKLKIGFVSGDFRQHPIGFVLLNTLKHLKNKNLELIAYSNSLKKDSLSFELKSHFTSWHEIEKQKDLQIINQISSRSSQNN